jgi:HNH endonuclease
MPASLPPPSAEEQIKFLNKIQGILADGKKTATYKFALLLALADLAVGNGEDNGDALTLHLDDISEKVIHYYWRQGKPFVVDANPDGSVSESILIQSRNRVNGVPSQAGILTEINKVRAQSTSWVEIQLVSEAVRSKLVKKVRKSLEENPLKRLQESASGDEFIYKSGEVTAGTIQLLPGVSFCLRRFHPIITELVHSQWTGMVRNLNQAILGEDHDLQAFLFGADRAALQGLKEPLIDLQGGKCFYCAAGVERESGHIDHFIPWSRFQVDTIHNFVLAHDRCNQSKSDHLAANHFLEKWIKRNRSQDGTTLVHAGQQSGFHSNLPLTFNIAKWAYATACDRGEHGWIPGNKFSPLVGWDRFAAG